MARSVNKVILVGNLTRDPEMKYTPKGHAVCSFGVATNREWTTNGEKQEAADFHNIVSWNKLAEICAQLLKKGTKVYVEGRLQTRSWEDDSGKKNYRTEIVLSEMVILSSKGSTGGSFEASANSAKAVESSNDDINFEEVGKATESKDAEEVSADEIPF